MLKDADLLVRAVQMVTTHRRAWGLHPASLGQVFSLWHISSFHLGRPQQVFVVPGRCPFSPPIWRPCHVAREGHHVAVCASQRRPCHHLWFISHGRLLHSRCFLGRVVASTACVSMHKQRTPLTFKTVPFPPAGADGPKIAFQMLQFWFHQHHRRRRSKPGSMVAVFPTALQYARQEKLFCVPLCEDQCSCVRRAVYSLTSLHRLGGDDPLAWGCVPLIALVRRRVEPF